MLTEALSISVRRNAPNTPSIVRGKGCFLYDEQDRGYLDMSGGSGAANLGYQRDDLVEVIKSQAQKLIHTGWNIDNSLRLQIPQAHHPVFALATACLWSDTCQSLLACRRARVAGNC
ncbi:aminotransferase class III-fold pyridoxal phosphate-dependent enzyme [Pseudomonas sp. 15FMM2]|uniref:Aminotransferase class III-fold pyridoxal phosphate-dependent enzyme n=1 Tax=Pseudomonas imrae TaxID=2992837 RepID=A0ACC7PJU3_9PSED